MPRTPTSEPAGRRTASEQTESRPEIPRRKACGSALPATTACEHGSIDLETRLFGMPGRGPVPHAAGLVQTSQEVVRQAADKHGIQPVRTIAERMVDRPASLVVIAKLDYALFPPIGGKSA